MPYSPTIRGAARLGMMFEAGQLDPVAFAEETFEHIHSCEDQTIFTHLTHQRALQEAHASRERYRQGRRLGPLDGVPLAWKDLFALRGLPTTAGSRVLSPEPAAEDADIVTALTQAGLVSIGRVNMTEFAFSGVGLNPHFGTPRNPNGVGLARIPGGSSSGSGVAVARGLVPVSLASDTSGSVRVPAALNGIVGYKATAGRYSMSAVFPLAKSLDSLGVLSTNVEDAILVDSAVRGAESQAIAPTRIDDLRLVVPLNVVLDCDQAVLENFEEALFQLSRAGASVRGTVVPLFNEILELSERLGTLVNAEAFALHGRKVEGPEAARIDRRVVARLSLGARTTAEDYQNLIGARTRLIAEGNKLFSQGEIMVYPTTAVTAPEIGVLEGDDEAFFAANKLILRNTMLGNFLDWCGVSLPSGHDESGLPTGILLSAKGGMDEALLSAAVVCEATLAR